MSKQFKGKHCTYCAVAGASETGDHVFAREFFLLSQRHNLPKVPSCLPCNQKKSELEHYLTAILPFGGRHADATASLTTMVPKRLARNRKLHLELSEGSQKIWTKESSGLHVRTTALPFDGRRLEELLAFIVRGLMWHHWQVLLGTCSFVDVLSLTAHGEKLFARYSGMRAKHRVQETLGNRTFIYKGAQGVDNPRVSVWEFSVFGGLKLIEDDTSDESVTFGAFTGPKHVKENADLKIRTGRFLVRG
jgi:hypothetical protein